jgi:hypothetical protein
MVSTSQDIPALFQTDDLHQPNPRNDRHMNSVIPSTVTGYPTSASSWYLGPVIGSPDLEHSHQPGILVSPSEEEAKLIFPSPPQPMPTGPEHWEAQRKEWLKKSKHVPPVDETVSILKYRANVLRTLSTQNFAMQTTTNSFDYTRI